jgi:hypothetical protein
MSKAFINEFDETLELTTRNEITNDWKNSWMYWKFVGKISKTCSLVKLNILLTIWILNIFVEGIAS